MKIIILDTETTGLLPKGLELKGENLHLFPYVVQFSYIIYDTSTNQIIKMVDHIIKLPLNVIISEENSNIHKITNEISQTKGIEIRLSINEFMEDLKNIDLIVAHNLEFDINMLKIEFYREATISDNIVDKTQYLNFLDPFVHSNKLYCTMKNSINLCNIKMKSSKNGREYLKFPKLNELHIKLFHFSPRNLHNSLNDVLICLRCYFMLKYNFDIVDTNSEIKDLLNDLIN
jgi:DNA polymerase III epsilon subunit-like protein